MTLLCFSSYFGEKFSSLYKKRAVNTLSAVTARLTLRYTDAGVLMKVAWIGAGGMGSSMARNIKNAGYEVTIFSRTLEKVATLTQYGIRAVRTVAECVKGAQIVCTMVGYPSDVEQIYLGRAGIFENAERGAFLVDMTTSSPLLARRLYEYAHSGTFASKAYRVVDAPVSGGDIGAREGTLSVMVGCDEKDFTDLTNLFKAVGKNILRIGGAGAGQHCKACNQIAVAANVCGCAEAVSYAKKNGLDVETVLKAISGGAAASWQMNNNAPKMLSGDYKPGFFNKHFIKAMKIVREVMESYGAELPVLTAALKMYESLVKRGFENEGTQSIIRYYMD